MIKAIVEEQSRAELEPASDLRRSKRALCSLSITHVNKCLCYNPDSA